jgi:hypothetical protein
MASLIRLPIAPWVAGIAIGIVAALAGTIGGVGPPDAYGLCTTCHGRDLLLGLAQPVLPGVLDVPAMWPMLTVVGVMGGAWLARRATRERATRETVDRLTIITRFGQGFAAMSLALLALGCPLNLTLRTANLAVEGMIGLGGAALGIWIGVQYLRARA